MWTFCAVCLPITGVLRRHKLCTCTWQQGTISSGMTDDDVRSSMDEEGLDMFVIFRRGMCSAVVNAASLTNAIALTLKDKK